jgi:hypothetical protein
MLADMRVISWPSETTMPNATLRVELQLYRSRGSSIPSGILQCPPQHLEYLFQYTPQLLLSPPFAARNSSIFATRSLNSSYWHFSYECRSFCES